MQAICALLAIAMVHSDNRLASAITMGIFATGVAAFVLLIASHDRPFDPGGLRVELRPAPGTGLQSPETGSQNRRYRDLSWRQRSHVPHLNPRKCPQIAGYSSETS